MILKVRVYATFVNLKIAKDTVIFRNNTFYTCKAFWITFMCMSWYVFMYLSFDVHLFIVIFIHTISSHFDVCFHLSLWIYTDVSCFIMFCLVPSCLSNKSLAGSMPRQLQRSLGVFGERGMVVTSYRFLNLSVMFFDLGDVFFLFLFLFSTLLGEIFTLMLTNLSQVGWNDQLGICIYNYIYIRNRIVEMEAVKNYRFPRIE